MYLDFDSLYNETQGDAFSGGKKKFYDDKVKSLTTAQANGKFEIRALVGGERDYACKISFDEQGGLYDYSCDCDGFNLESGPCKHIVATALYYEEKNPTNATAMVKKKTDTGAYSLISEYNKKKHRRHFTGDSVKTELIPYLVGVEDGYRLRFTIGNKKQYNLKDLSDFVSSINSCGYRRYGVDLELYHAKENFTASSQKLIDFIVKCYLQQVEAGITGGYKDELRLLRGDIDEFFALNEGTLVYFGKTDLTLVAPFNQTAPLKLIIKEVDEGFEVSLSERKIKFIDGKDYDYMHFGNGLYRISKDYSSAVRVFCDTVAIKGSLFVAENDMSAFYNSVIVGLIEYLDLESDGIDLSVYEAAPFICKIYINGKDGAVSLDIDASYDDKKVDIMADYVYGDYVRDWDSENALRGVLASYFPEYPDLILSGDDEIFRFLTEGVKELFKYAEVFITDSMKKMNVRRAPRIHVGVRLSGNLLNLELSADDYTQDELQKILTAYREKRRYIRLGGGFVALEDSSIEALGEILEVARFTENGFEMPRYYAPFVNGELQTGFFSLSRDSAFKTLLKSLESVENADIEVPETVREVMRNYQKTGYRWLKMLKENNFGGILADDMGLGKSLQVIALILEQKSKAIIVCPTTLILNWVSEIQKFAPSLKTLAVMGTLEERKAQIDRAMDYDVVITSYDLMRRDYELYERYTFDYAIADEAQFIKNPETKNAIAVKRLNANHRFALTGTPIENNLGELWSIFDFIMPEYLGSYDSFRDRYELDIVRGETSATQRLQRIVKPFILRRLKVDVLKELPPKTESTLSAPLEDKQKELYDANLALIRDSVRTTPDISKVVVLSMLTKLRQICCDPSLVYPDYDGNSAKMEACMELVERAVAGGHRILLFSQFTGMLDIIRRKLADKGITYYLLKGDTPKSERLHLVNKFNAGDTKVFLISLKAGGTGLNLTGADVVIHYDPWWNESVMNQATDRAYRIGQTRSVQVYKLVVKDSLEEKIMALQQRKSALSTSVVGKTSSIKEIIELLS